MQIISKLDVVFLWVWSSIIVSIGIIGTFATGNLMVLGIFALVELVYLFFALRRPYGRTRAIKKPFPLEWKDFLVDHFPFYRNIDAEAKKRFQRDIRIFLNDFSIEGTRRQEVDMDMKLQVAAGIATMLHGRPDWEPPFRDGVVIYPGNVFDRNYRSGTGQYAGMATNHAPLILTAGALVDSFKDPNDGYNVVFHETAHYFDFEDGEAEGIPAARMGAQKWYSWKNIFTKEWQKVVRGRSFLRDYAGKNEAEFFAVAVEAFFEKPWEMKEKNPELYDALKEFFNIDTYEILVK